MKAGLTLQQLAIELHRQNEAKQDFLVNTGSMQFETFGDQVYLQLHDSLL